MIVIPSVAPERASAKFVFTNFNENNEAGGYVIAEVFYLAFKRRFGHGVGGIICLGIVAVAIFFCGMSSVTANSRMAYAFSRDGAMPLSSLCLEVTVPDGSVWEMKLKKRNKDIFFSSKWEEYAEYYLIEYGCYLSFKYEGDSKFSVVIFDATSVEICYPLKTPCTNKERETECGSTRRMSEVAANERAEIEVAANEFNPKYPFFRSKFCKGRYPYVPAGFAKKYLKPNVPIMLQNADGEQWEVCCTFNMPNSPAMRIVKGYFEFHAENNLLDEDHCVFELIKETPVVLKVTVIRAID